MGDGIGGTTPELRQAVGASPVHNTITPSDTTDVTSKTTKGLYVVTAGNLYAYGVGDSTMHGPYAVVAGQWWPFWCLHVGASTTAVVLGLV